MTEPDPAHPSSANPAARALRFIEQALLMVAALMTLGAAGAEVAAVYQRGSIVLADILLMFLYTEVIAMIAVFYTGKASSFVFPIFIAITAIARLIVLQGKDMQAENVVFEAGAILLLAFAALVMGRVRAD
ncbi:phosphate-starvation-inducible PsiE family protein [Erythrobacter sp. WG]|uniref:phosphate-starvation-inducible PsiE family protein n=1 Tax=Erythrobacter sp. WG TaxID=2985510 RepID=UPI00227023B4|nr:phosphate-starvation-inducible PsiE family protein [Erythrobacter sp. WG]MCX9148102.1 phosphate-starvation-inducible PsiE family protein [Erythrobacter sp. WG]